MPTGQSPNFVKILGIKDPTLARLQDNVDATLAPLATAVISTPIMGAAPPAWIRPELSAGWVMLAVTSAAYSQPAFHRDALGYVHSKGFPINNSGGPLTGAIFTFPRGYRPGESTRFIVEGTGLAQNIISVTPNGNVTPQTAVINGGTVSLVFSFLAEQ